ncbi:hypothetical protein BDZ94DRAFT_1324266 [Collybia nuda]|uniref:FAD-binding PCMH-type domain-containing protein n=1 Tax=Collybia nuda TaxID=64659 RepID=A0A9P5Y2G9_9AGAR|nr:hypothetical protein BDZ94DRAFT_1324266 [Collybia nuda]
MVHLNYLFFLAASLLISASANPTNVERADHGPACLELRRVLPPGTVHNPVLDALEYLKDTTHWASSSTQLATCSVCPGTTQDVATILRTVSSTRTPFAVEGGGHASNPGFSSTEGVHISMSRFSEVTYDADTQTAVVGAGLIWDDVYAALAPHGVNVLGGRVTGVGVSGFMLGGGYSWKSNQYGLAVDSAVAFELVKPNGDVVNVTSTSDPTLFSGLKARYGGMNNFGIVTRFTLRTFPQTMVWGGLITYTLPHIPEVASAVADFSTRVTDPKASIITTYNFLLGQGSTFLILSGMRIDGIFEKFLAIQSFTKDIKTRDFLSLVKASPSNITYGQRSELLPDSPSPDSLTNRTACRAIFNTVSLTKYTPTILETILNETSYWGAHLSSKSGTFISYDVEPFLPDLFSHNTTPSAYPPNRSIGLSPLNIYYAWLDPKFDSDFHQAARDTAASIRNAAIVESQDIIGAPPYPNYAIFDTPLEQMYGSGLAGLKTLKASVDPTNVMGLAGGFKF